MERLQKVIANRGFCSRRKAEELIVKGRVCVNDQVVQTLGVKVSPTDRIEVEGVLLEQQEFVYYMLNKPKGYISSVSDEFERPVVVELIDTPTVNERIYPVGRLDVDTTGILLLTNDGAFMQAMTHPAFKIFKTYVAKVSGIATQYEMNKLLKGIEIEPGMKVAADDIFVVKRDKERNRSTIEITIHEGKYHQVKRMLEAVGHPVNDLKRIKYGCLTLENMPVGSHRRLKKHEVTQLFNQANLGTK